ncbi:unnamed protein product [Owenia fusiformis]|uniref:Methyltransferase-like protein 4 n=1 Tax=Owenia fusiformis TaxID=6347 RepID=A0A8S4N3Q1_OWEFU|nr:unnamed protein product [Owenia fusiformis]
MDSEYEKKSQAIEEDIPSKRRKRKRKAEPNAGELSLMEYHDEIKDILLRAREQLVTLGRQKQFIKDVSSSCQHDNNRVARVTAKQHGPSDTLVQISTLINQEIPYGYKGFLENDLGRVSSIFNRVVHHNCESPHIWSLGGDKYVIPSKTKFLMSDISNLDALLREGVKYNVIVLDPPWFNKAVRRKRGYKMLSEYDFYQVPIKQLISHRGVVLVWVTNKLSQIQFVTEQLFPQWGVTYHTSWYWIKITVHGEFIYDFDSIHKKPYETLVIGTKQPAPSLPRDRVLVSVPCSIHSRKPPLNNVLESVLPDGGPYLEMFARNLIPGWTSWGNEVLKFQHTDFYVS